MNENQQNKKIFNHDILKWVIIGLAGFVIIVLVFSVGVWIGGEKARFSYRWAESYNKNFAGPKEGFLGDWRGFPLPPEDFIEAHGVFGQIIKIDGSTIVIKGREDVEKIVLVKEDTVIKRFQDNVKIGDLKVDDYIVVIGEPNDAGQIEAKLIRIFPAPPDKTSFRPFPPGMRWQ